MKMTNKHQYSVKFNDEENEIIKQAVAEGLTPSDFIRSAIKNVSPIKANKQRNQIMQALIQIANLQSELEFADDPTSKEIREKVNDLCRVLR